MSFDTSKLATFMTVTLKGKAGQNGTLAYSKNGKPIYSFNVAVNKGPKEQRRTLWFTIKAFQALAESVQVQKGDTVFIEGSFDVSEWKDRQTGMDRSRMEVLADRIDVLPREERTQPSPSPFAEFPSHAGLPFNEISEEDVPF